MEIHATTSRSAVHLAREEHGVAPLLPPWTKAVCALQTADDRLCADGGGAHQSDSSCCCCSSITTCDGSDSATTEQRRVPVGGDSMTGCQQSFDSLQDAEGGEGGFARSHSSPALAKDCSSAYPSSVCVKERSIQVEELHSENGRFRFVLQPDRTLVLYMEEDDLWAVYLAPRACEANTKVRLILQKDGNLVAVDSSFRLVWESNTANKAPGPYTLTMENSGNCALSADGGVHLWGTRTAGGG